MAELTPYEQLRQLDFTVKRWMMPDDPDITTTAAVRSLDTLKRTSRAAVDRLKDYEMSTIEDNMLMQLKTLPPAIKALEKLRTDLLKASEYDVVSAIDVAQISAQLDELIDSLR